ncbi:MAG TPA: adenylyltransferase/cytidyltransferase family protein [Candidatus Tripitaka californicus]|uniref:adenylyltransferase/cytidyltransferase family protein n=1 Tax=Candidatus Tripitaka californicus TaxID=3367616 RepID=UPI00402745A4|nr:adenylyltransferase/cytidyltransferase family protein [Planctomycetota bacterium]
MDLQKKEIIVATSGGFDPVHVGHIRLFREAKTLGDKLVVILNSDDFLLKKKGYVFMPFNERKEILESIKYIDEVVSSIDTDHTVSKTLEKLRPDIFAKGGDRNESNTPELTICRELNIRVMFNVGGGKVQSSSWLVRRNSQ